VVGGPGRRRTSPPQLDVLDERAVRDFSRSHASTVLNLAAGPASTAEEERGNLDGPVYALNTLYPGRLAEACRTLGQHLVHVSTDYVFDGNLATRHPREDDSTGPAVCWYAETKLRRRGRARD
jgi:dTDP-4-dehydrorhamnose reductase